MTEWTRLKVIYCVAFYLRTRALTVPRASHIITKTFIDTSHYLNVSGAWKDSK